MHPYWKKIENFVVHLREDLLQFSTIIEYPPQIWFWIFLGFRHILLYIMEVLCFYKIVSKQFKFVIPN